MQQPKSDTLPDDSLSLTEQGVTNSEAAHEARCTEPAVAIMWARYGPYHCARLRGASAVLEETGFRVLGIEVARDDSDYGWSVIDGDESDRVTIFQENYGTLSKRRIESGVTEILDRLGPSAVAINGYAVHEAVAALAWCRRNRRPAILMSETHGHGRSRPWWKELGKRLRLRGFDAALVSGRLQSDYLQGLGFPASRIHVGYNAVDNHYFSREAARIRGEAREWRDRYRLPLKYFYANTRFMPRKNLDGLLRGYGQYLSEAGADGWSLVVTGSGDEGPGLERLIRELGLSSMVHWPGFIQYGDLPAHYALASAFIHPAKEEAWGLVLNEAAASGLPLLSGAAVGARFELLQEGKNGFSFDAFSDGSICEALLSMSRLPEAERCRMGEESARIVSKWGPERFGRGLLEALRTAGVAAAPTGAGV